MDRKWISFILAAGLVFLLTGCARRSTAGTGSSMGSGSSLDAGSSMGTESSTPDSSTQPEGSASGLSSGAPLGGTAENGLSPFRDALHTVYGDRYYPDTEMTEAQLQQTLGLTEDLYQEIYGENSMQQDRPDTFIAVKAMPGKAEAVQEKLQAYKDTLLSQEAFSSSREKIDAAQVYTHGDYVFFLLLGDAEADTPAEGLADAFGREIQKGIDAVRDAVENILNPTQNG